MKKTIKLFSPKFDNNEITAAVNAIKSSHWSSGDGKGRVGEFEKRFLEYTKAKECVAVNNGTAALHLALEVSEVQDHEVLVPSLTFISTVHSIIYSGGKPIFVDVIPETGCLDPDDMENKITKKTKAVIPVHFGGIPCNMNKIKNISKRHNLHIITDAAHACGAIYNNKKIGTEAEMVCFSYHPVKNIAMPKGGAITINGSNGKQLKNKLNSLRWCGIGKRNGPFYDIVSLGYNYYMDEISAAIGIQQLKKVDASNNIRKRIAKRYNQELKIEEKMPFDKNSSYHLYWIRTKNRARFMKNMSESGIEVGAHYKAAHLMSFYRSNVKLPITEQMADEIVTIPMHPSLTSNEIDRVIKTANLSVKQ